MRPSFTAQYPADQSISPGVLTHYFEGVMDAGNAGTLTVDQLLMAFPSERVTIFNTDALVDCRTRRPTMTFIHNNYPSIAIPKLALDLPHNNDGEDVLPPHGSEPGYRWNEFVRVMTHLAVSAGMSQTVGMSDTFIAVSHTCPTYVHHHSSQPGLSPSQSELSGHVELPGSTSAYLELRLGELGLDSRRISTVILYYVTHDKFPQGVSALLTAVVRATGLTLPVGGLETAANISRARISAKAARQPGVSAVIFALEAQYDAMAPKITIGGVDISAPILDLPSAEEVSVRLETSLEIDDFGDLGPQDWNPGHRSQPVSSVADVPPEPVVSQLSRAGLVGLDTLRVRQRGVTERPGTHRRRRVVHYALCLLEFVFREGVSADH